MAPPQEPAPTAGPINRARSEPLTPPAVAASATKRTRPCVLTIHNQKYDVSQWVNYHPGGDVILNYHDKDATDVFFAFHSQEAVQKLMTFKAKPVSAAPTDVLGFDANKSAVILEDFRRLRQDLENDGFFNTSPLWYTYKTVTTVGLLLLSLVMHSYQFYLLSALVLGLFWQQAGWLAHEFCHHQVFTNRTLNNLFGFFLGNLVQGMSVTWWKDRHNTHHASTNITGMDPDIDNLPMLAWSKEDLERAPKWVAKSVRYQHYYFLFILPFLKLIWNIQSYRFTVAMRTSDNQSYRSRYWAEAITLALHYAALAYVVSLVPTWGMRVAYVSISMLLGGFLLGVIVFFNHYSCEKYDARLSDNFVALQLYTTRNMRPSTLVDWLWGGLNYQIEHHLFPTMPRHNLSKAMPRVKAFCAKHDLPYMCSSFYDGLVCVLSFLEGIAKQTGKYAS